MEYYARPRQHHENILSSPDDSSIQSESLTMSDDALAAAFEQSIYLFPNPPSAPPSPTPSSSRAATSHEVLSTPFTLFESRDRSPTQSSAITGTSTEGDWDEIGTPLSYVSSDAESPMPNAPTLGRSEWDWTPLDEAEASMLEEEIMRTSRWDMAVALRRRVDSIANAEERRRAQQQLCDTTQNTESEGSPSVIRRPSYVRPRTISTATSLISGPTPHPRIHLPLLSFFASFLSLDPSTIHLLSHTPSHSILFPGTSSTVVGATEDVDGASGLHGMESLFASEHAQTSLREGLAVTSDQDVVQCSPFLVPPVGLTHFLDMVKAAWQVPTRLRTMTWKSPAATSP